MLQVKKIDRKLKLCHNPLLDPSSTEFQKAAAEKLEREAEAKACKVSTSETHSGVATNLAHRLPLTRTAHRQPQREIR